MAEKPKPFKALKAELVAVKKRWSDVKLFWKKPPPPWPVRIQRVISQSAPYAFDVDDIKILLFIEGPAIETCPVRVEIGKKCPLPQVLKTRIAKEIKDKWCAVLKKQSETATTKCWFVERLLMWMESQFVDFLRLVPECVETYMGCDAKGATMRRYAIIEPKNEESSDSATEEKPVERVLTEEEIARKKMVEERRQRKQREAAHKAACEREARRQKAMRMKEMGIDIGGPRIESKKEKAARLAAKKKQGVRMRKTGARATKYAGPGSALEKTLSKKERKKREKEAGG